MKGSKKNPTTAAIGDGANDVSMIQEAHVGLGMVLFKFIIDFYFILYFVSLLCEIAIILIVSCFFVVQYVYFKLNQSIRVLRPFHCQLTASETDHSIQLIVPFNATTKLSTNHYYFIPAGGFSALFLALRTQPNMPDDVALGSLHIAANAPNSSVIND